MNVCLPERYELCVPQELLDNIIDHLYDDRGTLLSTCLVSRSWAPSSRLHLFRTITLRCPNHTDGSTFSQFVIFATTHPEMAAFIRTLKISSLTYPVYRRRSEHKRPIVTPRVLHTVIHPLQRLETLHLLDVRLLDNAYDPSQPVFPGKHKLCRLTLDRIEFQGADFLQIVPFLSVFAAIRELQIEGVALRGEHMVDLTSLEYQTPIDALITPFPPSSPPMLRTVLRIISTVKVPTLVLTPWAPRLPNVPYVSPTLYLCSVPHVIKGLSEMITHLELDLDCGYERMYG